MDSFLISTVYSDHVVHVNRFITLSVHVHVLVQLQTSWTRLVTHVIQPVHSLYFNWRWNVAVEFFEALVSAFLQLVDFPEQFINIVNVAVDTIS